MLIGYEANVAMRDSQTLGDYSRELIDKLSNRHIRDGYRALLFSTRIKNAYRSYFSGNSNVSTYLPTGFSKTLPSAWIRYHLNPWLKSEKVRLFHGLNEELPYHIDRDIKTVITCYGPNQHRRTSVMDVLLWRRRMHYSFTAADAIVAVSETVKQQLIDNGVNADKIVVIGDPTNPMQITDEVVDQYFELYRRLLNR